MKYAFFDGDKVGNSIRILLLSNSLPEAKELSENIKKSILKIESFLFHSKGVKVVIAGGDDILLEYDPDLFKPELIESIPVMFKEETGISMSFGVGSSVDESMENLNLAKGRSLKKIASQNMTRNIQTSEEDDATLVIFSDSSYPDPYINVIAHWDARINLRRLILLNVERDLVKVSSALKNLEQLEERIKLQIDLLSKSQYLRKKRGTKNEWETIEIQLSQTDKDFYRALSERFSSMIRDEYVYRYDHLDTLLSDLISNIRKSSVKPIFDISTVKKEFIVDIYVILSMENVRSINTFQLVPEPTYSEKDLIHCLRFDEQYKYRSVIGSDHTGDKTVIFRKSVSNAQDYESRNISLQHKLAQTETAKDQLKLQACEEFASLWMTVFLFVIVLPVSASVAFLAFKNWDKGFEKYTFIVPVVLLFLISFILQAIFKMNFSLNPQSVRRALKDYKMKKLENY